MVDDDRSLPLFEEAEKKFQETAAHGALSLTMDTASCIATTAGVVGLTWAGLKATEGSLVCTSCFQPSVWLKQDSAHTPWSLASGP